MRRRLGWIALVIVLVVAFATATLAVTRAYVRPQTDALRRADAIAILGGPDYRRYSFGIGLAKQGWAPNVVVSNPHGDRDAFMTGYCREPHREFTLYCFVPDPPTTAGEALALRTLAREHGWNSVIVVTFRPHISRARHILGRCFDGELIMVESPASLTARQWFYQFAYQTAGYVRAFLSGSC